MRIIPWMALGATALAAAAALAAADDLRVVKRGETIPPYSLTALSGPNVDNASKRERASIIVYLSAQQVSSTRAAVDSQQVATALRRSDLELQHITADVAQANWFREFRDSAGVRAPLGLDFDRIFYGQLGVIVLPTTIVVDAKGRLKHVIAGYKPDFAHVLDAYARHALGLLDDAQLEEALAAKGFARDAPADRAARHRAAANLLRERGLLEDAEKELRKAIEIDPQGVDSRLDLASLCIALRRFDEAESLVNEAVKIEADNRRAKLLRGILRYHAGDLDEAERILTESLVLNTDPARAHYFLGLIHEARKNSEKALEHYRKALERLLGEKP